jgi:hypothetical protein
MKKVLIIIVFTGFWTITSAQNTKIQFDVFLKNKPIGKLTATEVSSGGQTIRDVRSDSEAKIFMFSVHVETDTKVISEGSMLKDGVAYRHSNRGPNDIHASTTRIAPKKYECNRNGTKTLFEQKEITFSITDLFFSEPVGRSEIYSNIFTQMVPLKILGNGRYQVTNPENKIATYTYANGKLVKIESETLAGTVTTKRS